MLANWVKETVTNGGTGALTLGGAPSGFVPFSSVFPLNRRFYYTIEDGADREVGIGYLSAADTLVREKIFAVLSGGTLNEDYVNGVTAGLSVRTSAVVTIDAVQEAVVPAPPFKERGGPSYAGTYRVSGHAGSAGNKFGVSADRVYYLPFLATATETLANAYVRVTTAGAAGTSAKIGIYRMNPNGKPGGLITSTAFFGVDTTGVKGGALGAPLKVRKGEWLFTAVAANGAVTLFSVSGAPIGIFTPTPWQIGGSYARHYAGFSEGVTAGWLSLPATAAGSLATEFYVPVVMFT